MSTSTKSNKNIPELIREHITLFDSFEHAYLFGSALDPSIIPNDIDLLVVYTEYSNKISNDLRLISDKLGLASGALIDLTALSVEEEIDTAFLEKIKPHYLKLK